MMAGQRQLAVIRSRPRLLPGLLILFLLSLGIFGAACPVLFVSSPLQGRGCLDRPLLFGALAWVPWPVHAENFYGGAQSFDLTSLVGPLAVVGGALAWVASLKPKRLDDGQEMSTSLYFSSQRLKRFQRQQRERAAAKDAAEAGNLMISAAENEPEDEPDKEDAADFDIDDYVERLEQGEAVDKFKDIPDEADAEKHVKNQKEIEQNTKNTKLPAAR